MTPEQLISLIRAGESLTVEFKSCQNGLSESVLETVCAFLNRSGGHILLGISDSGEVTGVHHPSLEVLLKQLANALNNPQQLSPTTYCAPQIVELEEKTVISIYVPESSQVHRFKNKIFDRIGDADIDITRNHPLVDYLYLRKRQEYTETEVCPFLTMDDLDAATFDKARRLASVSNPTHP